MWLKQGDAHRQNILERWLEEVPELFLCDELEERGFERVAAYVMEELHEEVKNEHVIA